eukprot:COSAG02_NODE_10487_length_1931_cov_1.963428_2_plen_88_part_00
MHEAKCRIQPRRVWLACKIAKMAAEKSGATCERRLGTWGTKRNDSALLSHNRGASLSRQPPKVVSLTSLVSPLETERVSERDQRGLP